MKTGFGYLRRWAVLIALLSLIALGLVSTLAKIDQDAHRQGGSVLDRTSLTIPSATPDGP